MCAKDRSHQDAHDVLNNHEDDRDDAQDDERPSARLQRRKLGGQSDGREEDEQEETRELARKLNRYAAELVEQGRGDGHQHSSDHGDGDIETCKKGDAADKFGRDHQRKQSHGEGFKICQGMSTMPPSTSNQGSSGLCPVHTDSTVSLLGLSD